ncbi:hypothetical protein ACROYT_G024116 [Oculina patagonica]
MNVIALVFVTLLAIQCRLAESLQEIRGKGGDCPYQRPAVNCVQGLLFASEDESECFDDAECSPSFKCCMQGCATKCVSPVNYKRWCTSPVDLAIVLDTQANTWRKVWKMTNKVVHKMSIRKDGTHVALVTTAKYSQSMLTFDQFSKSHMNRAHVWSHIKRIAPQKGRGRLSTALEKAREMFNETNGARENAIKVLVVITDANMDSDEAVLVKAASKSLRESGILVQTVGVTMEMNLMHLVEIATSDVYVWPGVDREMLWTLKKLEKQPCKKQ